MRFRLPQKIVYWAPAGAGNYGRQTLVSPVEFPARWEDGMVEVLGHDGQLVSSTARVYLGNDVLVGGLIMLGTLLDAQASGFPANPRSDQRVKEIVAREQVPSLKASQSLTTAHLK